MDLPNLLDDHPDGLGKHIQVYRCSDFFSAVELKKFVNIRLYELNEICVFVRHPSLHSPLLFAYGTDLVHFATEQGNEGIMEWLNSKTGIFYQDQAFAYLDLPRTECEHSAVFFKEGPAVTA